MQANYNNNNSRKSAFFSLSCRCKNDKNRRKYRQFFAPSCLRFSLDKFVGPQAVRRRVRNQTEIQSVVLIGGIAAAPSVLRSVGLQEKKNSRLAFYGNATPQTDRQCKPPKKNRISRVCALRNGRKSIFFCSALGFDLCIKCILWIFVDFFFCLCQWPISEKNIKSENLKKKKKSLKRITATFTERQQAQNKQTLCVSRRNKDIKKKNTLERTRVPPVSIQFAWIQFLNFDINTHTYRKLRICLWKWVSVFVYILYFDRYISIDYHFLHYLLVISIDECGCFRCEMKIKWNETFLLCRSSMCGKLSAFNRIFDFCCVLFPSFSHETAQNHMQ